MATTTRDQKIAKAKSFTTCQSTPVLVTSLRALGAQITTATAIARKTKRYDDVQALNLVAYWTREALENRYPEAAAAVEKAFDDDPDGDLDYDAILLAAIPVSGK